MLKHYNAETLQELARMLKVSNSCVKKWKRGERYIPSHLLDQTLERKMVLDIKDENWGRRKGGENGIRKLREKYPPAILVEWRRRGRRERPTFWCDKRKAQKIVKKIIKSRMEKRSRRILEKIEIQKDYFRNNFPPLNVMSVPYSRNDFKRRIRLPQVIVEPLAEEIGVHIGDGTLVAKRNYFSVRVSVEELEYLNYLARLYSQLYNIKPKIFVRGSICGFEIYSKALFEFKKALGLPIGKKKDVDIPVTLKKAET